MLSACASRFSLPYRQLLILLTVFCIYLSSIASAHAATYYVATNGSDSNPGSQAAPFKNVQKAVGVVRAGDTVIIKPGRHRPFDLKNIHGAPGAPITFFGEPGAIIDRHLGGGSAFRNIEFWGGSYITIDGLELTDTKPFDPFISKPCNGTFTRDHIPIEERFIQNAIKINKAKNGTYAHHIVLKNLNIHHIRAHVVGGKGYDLQLLNSHIHHNGYRRPDGSAIGQSYGTYIHGKWLVRGNRIHDNTGHGMRMGNVTSDENDLFLDSVVENNIIYNNGGKFEHIRGKGQPCITVDDGPAIRLYHGSGNTIRNNIMYGNKGGGIIVNENHRVSPTPNVIYNNTIYKNGFASGELQDGIRLQNGSGIGKTSIIKNNIVYGNSGKPFEGIGSGVVLSNNLTTDPRFVNPAGEDFHLQAGSPAIDKGVTLSEVPNDFYWGTRPFGAAYDIGAIEQGAPPGTAPDGGFLPGEGGGTSPGAPVLRGPNGEICPSPYLPLSL